MLHNFIAVLLNTVRENNLMCTEIVADPMIEKSYKQLIEDRISVNKETINFITSELNKEQEAVNG